MAKLSEYVSRFYPQLAKDIRAKWNEAARANAWPDWLSADTIGAFLQATDNDVERGKEQPEPGFWLSALATELIADQDIEPAPGYYAFAGAIADIAEGALDATSADASKPGWLERAWKAYGEPAVRTVAETVAPEDAPLTRAVTWVSANPGLALVGALAIVATGGALYTLGPALLLRATVRA